MQIAEDVQQALRTVGSNLLLRLDELTEAGNARISRELPSYRRLIPPDDLRESGRNVVAAVLKHLAGTDSETSAASVKAARERGRQRQQQGVSLDDVLRAIRLDFATLWEPIVETSASLALPPEAGSYAMLKIWEGLEGIMVAFSEGYRYQETMADREAIARRARVLTHLVYESNSDGTFLNRASEVLGLTDNEGILVAAARLGERQESHLEMRWRGDGSSAHVVVAGEHVVGVTRWSERNRAILDDMVSGYSDRLAVVVPVVYGLQNVHAAISLARSVIDSAPSGKVTEARHLLIDSLVAAQPSVATPLSRVLLSGIADLQDAERERLLETLHAWMAIDGTTADIARHLLRHRNTVINHLRRVEELTGLSTSRPADAATLITALKASTAWMPSAR